MTPLLTDLSCDAFGQVARGATVSGWTNLLRTSRGMRARVERWRSQAGRPWPWSPTALYLCAGRELSYEEADEVDDATVRTCLSLAGSPVHLVLHGLRLVTPQGPDGPLVRNLHVSACAVLTEWLRLPGRMDAMPLLNDFAPHAHVHAVLGACARCLQPPFTAHVQAIEVCEVCEEVMCRGCRETAVQIAGTCISCRSAVVCIACALGTVGHGWAARSNGQLVYECSLCRL